MAVSGMLMTLPYMSSGVAMSGMWLPSDLLILTTPSVPGRMPMDDADIRPLTQGFHQLAAAVTMLKSWSVPPTWTSAMQRVGVVALHQRVEGLVQVDRVALLPALAEVLARSGTAAA